MEPSLPPELAATYSVRRATPEDVDAVYELVVADRTFFFGECRVTREVVASALTSSTQFCVALVERDGRLEHVWDASIEPGTSNAVVILVPRPGLVHVEALDRAGWAWTLA